MKELVYKYNEKDIGSEREILHNGTYRGYNFFIVYMGIHPCAYVEVPKGHPWYRLEYQEIEDKIYCHGGLTYSDNLSLTLKEETDRWFFGWDYGHAGDYESYNEHFNCFLNDKKWTTEEIYEEVKDVIDQFVEHDRKRKKGGRDIMVSDEMLIVEALHNNVRVNVTTRTVEIFDNYGVKVVLRDLDDMTFEAFKNNFANF